MQRLRGTAGSWLNVARWLESVSSLLLKDPISSPKHEKVQRVSG